jgi:hypothetical protein
VQFVQGPVFAPNRVTGLAGAYGGYAEGVEGTYANSGAPAVREPFSLRYIDYDISGSLYVPAFFQTYDVENRGSGSGNAKAAVTAGLAGMLQIGRFGVSLSTDLQSFQLSRPSLDPTRAASDVTLRFGLIRVLGAYGFLDGQLAIGVGARGVIMQMQQDVQGNLLVAGGASPEIGAILRLDNQPFRVGVTVRAPVATTDIRSADGMAAGLILPKRVLLPAEIEAGVSVQIGARPLNPTWIDPLAQQQPIRREVEKARAARAEDYAKAIASSEHPMATRRQLDREEDAIRSVEEQRLSREWKRLYEARRARYLNWPRAKLLVVAGVLVTAPIDNSVSVIDFLNQQNTPFGRNWTASPRFGLEGEPIPDWLMVRVGGYVEPNRFEQGIARQHVTFGADLKLFSLGFLPPFKDTTLRIGMSFDLAPRYANWGLGLGVWH